MKCPECGCPKAKPLFQSVRCPWHLCVNYDDEMELDPDFVLAGELGWMYIYDVLNEINKVLP